MMLRDRFDQLMIVALVGVLIFTAVLMAGAGPRYDNQDAQAANRRFEREMLHQARVAFIERHYSPVITLRDNGSLPDALLKLEELSRTLPGEAHNDLLSGDILLRMGQFDRAVSKLAKAVRSNADYVDSASPLSERPLIESAVSEGLPLIRDRLRVQPDNLTLAKVLKDGYYLQSRLAGGCE
jgi:tetratricopeptide (TPR) repeat protein